MLLGIASAISGKIVSKSGPSRTPVGEIEWQPNSALCYSQHPAGMLMDALEVGFIGGSRWENSSAV